MRLIEDFEYGDDPRELGESTVWRVRAPIGEDGYFIALSVEETERLRSLLNAMAEARAAGNHSWSDDEAAAYQSARDAVEVFLAEVIDGRFFDPEYLAEFPRERYVGWPGREHHWSDECVVIAGCLLV